MRAPLTRLAGLLLLAAGCSPEAAWNPAATLAAFEPDGDAVIYEVSTGQRLGEATLLSRLESADFVLLGERHDHPDQHRLQALIVAELQRRARHPRAVAFEMIGSDQQLAIVEHLAAEPGDAAGLGRTVGWEARGWPDYAMYSPILAAALAGDGQIIAANLPETATRTVFESGPAALRPTVVSRTGLGRPFPVALANDLRQELDDAHCGQAPDEVIDGMFDVQRARDAVMADRLAAASGRGGGILIAGAGHVRTDRGVPWYLVHLEPSARIVSLAFLERTEADGPPPRDLPFDYVWYVSPLDPGEDPCSKYARSLERVDPGEDG
jgi:uncharacterized iron-regulated protein